MHALLYSAWIALSPTVIHLKRIEKTLKTIQHGAHRKNKKKFDRRIKKRVVGKNDENEYSFDGIDSMN